MSNLELVVSDVPEKKEKYHKGFFRNYVVDTALMEIYYTGLSVATGFFHGYPPGMSVQSNMLFIGSRVVTSRIYSKFRNFIFKIFKIRKESSEIKKIVADTLSFIGFHTPVYAGLFYSFMSSNSNFDLGEPKNLALLLYGGFSSALFPGLVSRPYGILLDSIRKKFGLEPACK